MTELETELLLLPDVRYVIQQWFLTRLVILPSVLSGMKHKVLEEPSWGISLETCWKMGLLILNPRPRFRLKWYTGSPGQVFIQSPTFTNPVDHLNHKKLQDLTLY